jgi:predicted metalloprotease with PDZ domain
MADDEQPLADVSINIHKGQGGYGIYFTQREGKVVVTKLDEGSEAQKAGVQPDDRLVSIQDNDKRLPKEDPGAQVFVTLENYGRVLDLVRSMNYCRMSFLSKGMQQFM